jgi:pimeloyl-ACP methyl ester carboxylesterase
LESLHSVRHFLCPGTDDFHRLAYREWNHGVHDRVLMCVHGVTRNSRDFLRLGDALQDRFRVICPDMAGRGLSDPRVVPPAVPMQANAMDVASVMTHAHLNSVNLLGTSMGGIVGMLLASRPHSPIQKLILNDVGPFIPEIIFSAVSKHEAVKPKVFATLEEAVSYHRIYCMGFGPMNDEQWVEFTLNGLKETDQGWVYDCHPSLRDGLSQSVASDVDLWHVWDKIQCPVLVLRGQKSIALQPETAERMQKTGPCATVIEIPQTGHAPPLMNEEQIGMVRDFLGTGA